MDLYLSADERRDVLRDYGKRHDLRILIETGTNDGGTPWYLMDDFDLLYTIELGVPQWRAAIQRFAKYPKVKCLHGDSADVLPDVLTVIDQPALIWLDGHHSGPGTAHGAKLSTPVRDELHAVFEDGRPHVVIIDDARIFDGGPEHSLYPHYADYPSLQWVEEIADAHDYSYDLTDDMIRLLPRTT